MQFYHPPKHRPVVIAHPNRKVAFRHVYHGFGEFLINSSQKNAKKCPKFSQIPQFFPGLRRSWRAWVRTSSCPSAMARWGAGTPEASRDRCDPPRPAAARGRSAATWDLSWWKTRWKMCFQGEKPRKNYRKPWVFGNKWRKMTAKDCTKENGK